MCKSFQKHNSLISRRSRRQRAGFGLCIVVWLRAMWTMECQKEPFILTCIPFTCVTDACPICLLEGRVNPKLAPTGSLWVCVVLAVSNDNGERLTGSLFCFDNTTGLVSAGLSISLSALRPFYFIHNQITHQHHCARFTYN